VALTPGTRLGPYEILAPLGAGGMGEVYRARDAKLNRDVALKILPDTFINDADRLARFRREAQVLASLNHPNIAAIYGFEDSGATHGLILELVEGPTLADRIVQGPIPLHDAMRMARQIADALEAAHELGIVHRDLKPANIKLKGAGDDADGVVKVLDFGLAKAMTRDAGSGAQDNANSPTLTANATAMGTIIGTAAYMSPEQARGRPVDRRADIWAFGAVVYEMLSGRAAFPGDTVTDILAAVVTREPDWAALPPATPASIRRLLARCLTKDPKRRLRDIGDAQPDLTASEDTIAGTAGSTGIPASKWSRLAPWIVAAGLAIALAMSLSSVFGRAPIVVSPVRRFTIEIPAKSAPNWNDFRVAISTDGSQVAYNCREGNAVSLCVRSLDSLAARRVTEGRDAVDWSFSPDGEWIGIVDEIGLWKVSIRGGEPQSILRWSGKDPAPDEFFWGPDNFILFGSAGGIQRVSVSGGAAEFVTRVESTAGVIAHDSPTLLPDHRGMLITIVHSSGGTTAGFVEDGSVRDLGIRGQDFVYLPQGWLMFRQGTTVLAAPFDPDDPARPVNPVPVIENVQTRPRISSDGSLVYVPTRGESNARLVWVDRTGRPTNVESERLDYTHLDLAPDGRRALLNLAGGKTDLIDLQSGTRKLLVQGGFPIWSSTGDKIIFRGSSGLQSAPVDGSAKPETLVPHPGFVVPTSWNSVTGELAYYDHRDFEIWIRSADGKTRRFLGAPGRKRSGRFSPDGKWMAFVSDETGEYQVYVTAYPGPGPTVAVSTRGGLSPIWSAKSNELFFRLGEKVMVARLSAQSPLTFTAPVELFDGPYTLDLMGHQREDVAPDGQRFLMVENSDDFPIVVVQNWPLELKRLVR